MRCSIFDSYFNDEFYYADSAFLPESGLKKKAKSKRSVKVRSL